MNKIMFIVVCLLIQACNTDSVDNIKCADFIVSGQSNAARTDWSYFEDLSGYSIFNIASGGKDINWLIKNKPNDICIKNLKGIFFVHGEKDSRINTNKYEYIKLVERYRTMFGDLPMFVNLVGVCVECGVSDEQFMVIRESQVMGIDQYESWHLGFSDADNFRDWGMLSDSIHYSKDGQQMMMDSFYNEILDYGF